MFEGNPYFYGTGRRKSSVARVRVYKGTGKITINDRDIDDYFGLETLKLLVRPPMDNLPILNLKHGWGGYVVTLSVVALLLIGIFHVIVTPIDKAKRKKAALKETE